EKESRGIQEAGNGGDGGARPGDAGFAEAGSSDVRLREQHSNLRVSAGREERVRLSGICAGVHPAAILRGQRAVPVGRAFGRGFGHRADGSTGAGNVSKGRVPESLDQAGAEAREISRVAIAHLLAGIWRARQVWAGAECVGGEGETKSSVVEGGGSFELG